MPPRKRTTGTFGVVAMDTGRFTDFSLSCLNQRLPDGWNWMSVKNYDCAASCNWLVEHFTGDHLLLMGDDHVFPPDLPQLLSAHDLDIVAPLVLGRRVPFEPVCSRDGKPWEPEGEPGLYEVEETGTAGMLIKREVFEATESPWFNSLRTDEGQLSDDIFFCRKAKEAGFKIHVDTSIVLSHLAVLEIRPFYGEDGKWRTRLSVGDRELINIERTQRQG